MNNNWTIKAENVSIRFILGDRKAGLKGYLLSKNKEKNKQKFFWADKDINFTLYRGDMLGIIGANGAGKSTLLKAISGIMRPIEGEVKTRGRIAALLELSAGFDKDLTVKDNTFLRGALLGYTEKFMRERYDEIIAFAELEDFQDSPLRQLSSGMKSRLAFSIACLVEPDILILDEVLSVGDGAFRQKSGDRMKEVISSGITGLIVSHSVEDVRTLCNKVLWLDHGKQIVLSEDVELWCDVYERFLQTKKIPQTQEEAKLMQEELALQKAEKSKERMNKIGNLLEQKDRDKAIEMARRFLLQNKPELLRLESSSSENN